MKVWSLTFMCYFWLSRKALLLLKLETIISNMTMQQYLVLAGPHLC